LILLGFYLPRSGLLQIKIHLEKRYCAGWGRQLPLPRLYRRRLFTSRSHASMPPCPTIT